MNSAEEMGTWYHSKCPKIQLLKMASLLSCLLCIDKTLVQWVRGLSVWMSHSSVKWLNKRTGKYENSNGNEFKTTFRRSGGLLSKSTLYLVSKESDLLCNCFSGFGTFAQYCGWAKPENKLVKFTEMIVFILMVVFRLNAGSRSLHFVRLLTTPLSRSALLYVRGHVKWFQLLPWKRFLISFLK